MLLKKLLHIRLGAFGYLLMLYNFWIWIPVIITIMALSWKQDKVSAYLSDLADTLRIYLIPFHLVTTIISTYIYFFNHDL